MTHTRHLSHLRSCILAGLSAIWNHGKRRIRPATAPRECGRSVEQHLSAAANGSRGRPHSLHYSLVRSTAARGARGCAALHGLRGVSCVRPGGEGFSRIGARRVLSLSALRLRLCGVCGGACVGGELRRAPREFYQNYGATAQPTGTATLPASRVRAPPRRVRRVSHGFSPPVGSGNLPEEGRSRLSRV